MNEKLIFLKKFGLVESVGETTITALSSRFVLRESRRGSVVFQKGDHERRFFQLVKGCAKVTDIGVDGGEIVTQILLPGDIFGDVLLSSQSSPDDCVTIVSEQATYLSIDLSVFASCVADSGALTLNYFNIISQKFTRLERRYLNLMNLDVRARLMFCLQELASKDGRSDGDAVVFENNLTHQDLANLVSASRQTVTTLLREMKRSGKIDYNRREIYIRNCA